MMIQTSIGIDISEDLLHKYIKTLVNKFFKILPILENKEESIDVYMDSLDAELIGFKNLVVVIDNDPLYLSLLSIFKWLVDNVGNPDCGYKRIRREVFHAISICNKLEKAYSPKNDSSEVM